MNSTPVGLRGSLSPCSVSYHHMAEPYADPPPTGDISSSLEMLRLAGILREDLLQQSKICDRSSLTKTSTLDRRTWQKSQTPTSFADEVSTCSPSFTSTTVFSSLDQFRASLSHPNRVEDCSLTADWVRPSMSMGVDGSHQRHHIDVLVRSQSAAEPSNNNSFNSRLPCFKEDEPFSITEALNLLPSSEFNPYWSGGRAPAEDSSLGLLAGVPNSPMGSNTRGPSSNDHPSTLPSLISSMLHSEHPTYDSVKHNPYHICDALISQLLDSPTTTASCPENTSESCTNDLNKEESAGSPSLM